MDEGGGGKLMKKQRKGRFFFFFWIKELRKCRVIDRESIGYGLLVLWTIDSCDVYTRLENLLPLHEVRAARPEARRVTEWRVDLRTPTRVRFLASFAPQAPHHWCTPARHPIALGSLHTLSRRALASTHIFVYHATTIPEDCQLSFHSLFILEGSAVRPAAPFFSLAHVERS